MVLPDDLNWDFFDLEAFQWTDLLHFLGVPHYSNEHRDDQSPLLYELRTVCVSYPSDEEDDDGNLIVTKENQQLLVIWRPETDRPTDEQIQTEFSKDD